MALIQSQKKKIVEIGYDIVINFIKITSYKYFVYNERAVQKGHFVNLFEFGHLYNITILIFYCFFYLCRIC